ncbi:ImmA/IrrE family metallo-endopeptidase [Paenibacillus camerounensis]|uniref:ImmA/IrrE family metallo-endopeptidase n=1 Tax=Paenibacillus camerounensis TaxID=1243663 RepID=UPI0005A8D735|nr:ImmA/IrrE family metallo-endopeptidase [Paenibacillus camerounensis]
MSKFPYLSPEQLENIALHVLYDFGINCDEQSTPMAIPIEEIIEFHYGLDFSWEPIDHFDSSGVVMAAIIPSQKKIIMNDTQKDLFSEKIGTMKFTMAHELGHWVLHVDDKENQQTVLSLEGDSKVFYCRSSSVKPPVEIQADMFAGAILMPKPVMQKAIANLKSTGKIAMPSLYWLAQLLNVSISALCYRLKQLDLLYVRDGQVYNSESDFNGQIAFDF